MKSSSYSFQLFRGRPFWAAALALIIVCAAAFYQSGQIIEAGQYLLKNPWVTAGVFFCFWFPALLIVEYVVLLFVPLQWSVRKARTALLLLEALVAFGLLIYARLLWTSETLIGTPWIVQPQVEQLFLAACIGAIIARVIFFRAQGDGDAQQKVAPTPLWHFAVHCILITAILGFGWFQTTQHLSGQDFDLQNDDFLQYGAAVGYLRTGDYVDWNFTTNTIQTDAGGAPVIYDRAWVSTWQIAQSMQLFGQTEFAARLPAIVWFLIFLLIVYITAFVWTRSFVFATLAAVSPIFFDGVVLHARMVRMYSPLLTIGAGIVISFWYTYIAVTQGKIIRTIFATMLTFGLFVLGWLHHELILILAPAMIIFIAYEWLRYGIGAILRKRTGVPSAATAWKAQVIRTILLSLLVIAALVLWALNEYLDSAIFTLGHLGVRNLLNMEYEFLAFMDFALPLTVMVLYLVGIGFALLHPRASLKERYLAVVSLTVTLVLLIVVKRYKAYRYIQFLLPVVWGFVMIIWYRWLHGILRLVYRSAHDKADLLAPIVASITFFVVFVPLAFVGVAAQQPWLTTAEADRLYENDHGFGTQAAYQFIRQHKTIQEPVFGLSFRDQYWPDDPHLRLVAMRRRDTYTLEELQTDMAVFAGTPLWFVWEDAKDGEVPDDVRRLIAQQAQNLAVCTPAVRASGMHIYYWGNREIPCDPPPAHSASDWSDGHPVVTHAMGNVGDAIRTNSKEGLRESLEEGAQVIEADFVMTKDNRLVLKHDWLVNVSAGKPAVERPQFYRDFMQTQIEGGLTPLDARQLLGILVHHPEVYLVIDAKGKDYVKVLELLKADIEFVDPALFKQIVLQTYHPEDVAVAKQFSDQSHILFTIYRTTLSESEILTFIKKENISVITIPKERYSDAFAAQLRALPARVYVHTVNDADQAKRLMEKGAYGVYSDTLTKKDLVSE